MPYVAVFQVPVGGCFIIVSCLEITSLVSYGEERTSEPLATLLDWRDFYETICYIV